MYGFPRLVPAVDGWSPCVKITYPASASPDAPESPLSVRSIRHKESRCQTLRDQRHAVVRQKLRVFDGNLVHTRGFVRQFHGLAERVRIQIQCIIGSKNSRIPRGGNGVHLLVLTLFFVEPAVGIEPTTCWLQRPPQAHTTSAISTTYKVQNWLIVFNSTAINL